MSDFEIISWTSHYVRIDDWWYREAWVRTSTGEVRFYAIPDGPVGA